ncbi:hypothetical protein CCB80_03190 [Armatimonadetes bacterium Uphvl-Ar1]|nr:hypothetical protein CCB80_03190 [Armatimonadetes bacterium Uphvl-Ar1]
MSWKTIIAGAVGGFLAALAVDVNAWSKSNDPFDWGLAVKRWVAGAIAGATGGFSAGYLPE